jgi:hypothetical protein
MTHTRSSTWLTVIGLTLQTLGGCGTAQEDEPEKVVSALTSPTGGTASKPLAGSSSTAAAGACPFNVTRHQNNGRLLTSAAITGVFWGQYWTQTTGSPSGATERTQYHQVWNEVGNGKALYSRMAEYGINAGTWGSSVNANTTLTGPQGLSEATIQSTLRAEITAGTLPAATNNSLYVIFLPPNVTSDVDTNGGFAGHHNFTMSGSQFIAYAVVEYQANHDQVNPVVSHEISEAATDPDTTTGYFDGLNEIGDICRLQFNNLAAHQVEKVWSQTACRCVDQHNVRSGDFNADWRSDNTVWRPSTGQWFVLNQFITQFGTNGDIPVPADYNGDGKMDVAVWRPSTGQWFVQNQFTTVHGLSGDVPVPADYNGDGKADLAVWRPSTGQWFVLKQFITAHGINGDTPVPGDFNGDGKADLAVWRPSTGQWFVLNQFITAHGINGDMPVPADFNGDGKADLAVWRPSTGQWFVLNQFITPFGLQGDMPLLGDFDGNGGAEPAVWRPSTGEWFVQNLPTVTHGLAGDIPIRAATLH